MPDLDALRQTLAQVDAGAPVRSEVWDHTELDALRRGIAVGLGAELPWHGFLEAWRRELDGLARRPEDPPSLAELQHVAAHGSPSEREALRERLPLLLERDRPLNPPLVEAFLAGLRPPTRTEITVVETDGGLVVVTRTPTTAG